MTPHFIDPMRIQRYVPPESDPLYPYVQSVFDTSARHGRELVFPKCNVDVLFNLGEPILVAPAAKEGSALYWRRTLIAGLQTKALVSRPQGPIAIVGLSLKAATARAVLSMPLSEIADRILDGALVLPELEHLWERIAAEQVFATRLRLLQKWLADRIRPASNVEMIRYACGVLEHHLETRSLDAITRAAAVSGRHLRRLFRQHIGVGPSQYLRLSRFITTLQLMKSPLSLTEIAHQAHYFDQAHFCHDFREITGMSPRQYREESGPAVGHVFYPEDDL